MGWNNIVTNEEIFALEKFHTKKLLNKNFKILNEFSLLNGFFCLIDDFDI